jgi:hypothetical protein
MHGLAYTGDDFDDDDETIVEWDDSFGSLLVSPQKVMEYRETNSYVSNSRTERVVGESQRFEEAAEESQRFDEPHDGFLEEEEGDSEGAAGWEEHGTAYLDTVAAQITCASTPFLLCILCYHLI